MEFNKKPIAKIKIENNDLIQMQNFFHKRKKNTSYESLN